MRTREVTGGDRCDGSSGGGNHAAVLCVISIDDTLLAIQLSLEVRGVCDETKGVMNEIQ